MSLQEDLRGRMLASSEVNALVEGSRVYWKLRPQKSELPAIVLHIAAGSRAQGMAGVMGTQSLRIQADCLASTKAAAESLRIAAMEAIEVGAATIGGTAFQGGFVNLFRDDATDLPGGGIVHTEQIDATIWFA